jgi:hypothetical protein
VAGECACRRLRAGVHAAAIKAGGQTMLTWMRAGDTRVEAGEHGGVCEPERIGTRWK